MISFPQAENYSSLARELLKTISSHTASASTANLENLSKLLYPLEKSHFARGEFISLPSPVNALLVLSQSGEKSGSVVELVCACENHTLHLLQYQPGEPLKEIDQIGFPKHPMIGFGVPPHVQGFPTPDPFLILLKSGVPKSYNFISAGNSNASVLDLHPSQQVIPTDTVMLARRFGKLNFKALAALYVLRNPNTNQFSLYGTGLFETTVQFNLQGRPLAVAFTPQQVLLGLQGETLTALTWDGVGFQPDPKWPAAGVPLTGEVQGLAVVTAKQTHAEYILAATSERMLFVLDTTGHILERIQIPHNLTALDLSSQNIWLADELGQIAQIQPVFTPLADDPLPRFTEISTLAPSKKHERLTCSWFTSQDPALVAAASEIFCKGLLENRQWADEILKVLEPYPFEIAQVVIAHFARHILEQENYDQPSVRKLVDWMGSFALRSSLEIKRLVSRVTGQIIAHFGTIENATPEWNRLTDLRAMDDREWLEFRLQSVASPSHQPKQAVALSNLLGGYAEMLNHRYVLEWSFSTIGPIRVVLPFERGASVLAATRDGQVFQLDLHQHKVIQKDLHLDPSAGIPNAMAYTQDGSVFLATSSGKLYKSQLDGTRIEAFQPIGQVEGDIRNLVCLQSSSTATSPWRLVIGSSEGQIHMYQGGPDGENWQLIRSEQLPVGEIRALVLCNLPNESMKVEPTLLAGGSTLEGRGCLYQLNPETLEIRRSLSFLSPVLAIKAMSDNIAMVCSDGFVYRIRPDGWLNWRWRAGLTARNLEVCDLIGDQGSELVIGAESYHKSDGNYLLVLDQNGLSRWIIPMPAPVVNVQSFLGVDQQPRLIVTGLDHSLQVIKVIPPLGRTENEVTERTKACLKQAAETSGYPEAVLLETWLYDMSQPELQGYACFRLSQASYGQIPDAFLDLDPAESAPIVQRAYLRSLVDLVARPDCPEPIFMESLRRLEALVANQSGIIDYAVLAALREIALLIDISIENLDIWSPILRAASEWPQHEIRHNCLMLIKRILSKQETLPRENLPKVIWDILKAILQEGNGYTDPWIAEDISLLLREMLPQKPQNDETPSSYPVTATWRLYHQALMVLKSPSVLISLGQNGLKRLGGEGVERAICCLGELARFESPTETVKSLQALGEALQPSTAPALARAEDPFLQVYRLMSSGAALANGDEWQRFAGDLHYEGGIDSLKAALRIIEADGSQLLEYYEELLVYIHEFTNKRIQVDTLQHLYSDITHLSIRIFEDGSARKKTWISPLWAGLAGMLKTWTDSDGVLVKWIEDVRRPAEPKLEYVSVTLMRGEMNLIANLMNPSFGARIDDLQLFLDDITLEARGTFLKGKKGYFSENSPNTFTLNSQEQRRLEIRLPLTEAELNQLRFDTNGHLRACLRIPILYYKQASDLGVNELSVEFLLDRQSLASLNLRHDLPTHWQSVRKVIDRQLKERNGQMLLLECADLARSSLLEYLISQCDPNTFRLFELQNLISELNKHRDFLAAQRAILAWFAERIWRENADLPNLIRGSGSPATTFLQGATSQHSPEMIIFNQWDRLIDYAARLNQQIMQVLYSTLEVLLSWCQKNKIPLILVGSYLSRLILTACWPRLASRIFVINVNRVETGPGRSTFEMADAVRALLKDRNLLGLLDDSLEPSPAQLLCEWSGGHLQVLELMLDALSEARRYNQSIPKNMQEFFLNYARRQNFFSSWWMWQGPFERITLAFTAVGEISLEQPTWAETGMVLAHEFYPYSRHRRMGSSGPIASGTVLKDKEAAAIRRAENYQYGDISISGLVPFKPIEEWNKPGAMWMQVLSAGGRQVLEQLAEDGLMKERASTSLPRYYHITIPLYRQWLIDTRAAEYMMRAAENSQENWFPGSLARLAENSRGELLFPGRNTGSINQDLPLTQLTAIRSALTRDTRLLFMKVYGLRDVNTQDTDERWSRLVDFSGRLRAWFSSEVHSFGPEATMALIASLKYFFALTIPDTEGDAWSIHQQDTDLVYFSLFAEIGKAGLVLNKKTLFILLHDDRVYNHNELHELRRAADEFLRKHDQEFVHTADQDKELPQPNVIFLITPGPALELQQNIQLLERRSPYIILLTPDRLASILISQNTTRALLQQAFSVTGRVPFSPYRLSGSLDGDSRLFVGRVEEIEHIMQNIDRDHYAIVGSRRIGKTSLLTRIEYLLKQEEAARKHYCLFLRLSKNTDEVNFYELIRAELVRMKRPELANRLAQKPEGRFHDLQEVMQILYDELGRPVVLLIDEVDALYFYDFYKNKERLFQFLRNNLAQTHLCTFIMTGYHHVYMKRYSTASVFNNFCTFIRLQQVQSDDVARLVNMIYNFNVDVVKPDEILGEVMKGTFGIPYLVQRACYQILQRLDLYRLHKLEPETVKMVVDQKLNAELILEFWDKLEIDDIMAQHETDEEPDSKELQICKIKVILLSTVEQRYESSEKDYEIRLKPDIKKKYFTSKEVTEYVRPHVDPKIWDITPDEVDRLLRSLTMLLIMSPYEEQNAYLFTNDILPNLLMGPQSQKRVDLFGELYRLTERLENLKQ